MRASAKAYQEVANRCSEYLPIQREHNSNSRDSENKSCLTCRHFENEKYFCKIDLYDRIVRNHRISED